MSKYLARAGWEVHVVTTAADSGAVDGIEGVHIHRVAQNPTLNDSIQRITQRWSDRSEASGSGESRENERAQGHPHTTMTSRGGLRRLVAYGLKHPDYARGWILKAALAARRLITSRRIELVVSSGPPHSAHLACLLATRGTGAEWISDLRDPWAEGFSVRVPPLLRHSSRIQARIGLGTADRIWCNSEALADVLRGRYRDTPVEWVANGVDLEELPPVLPATGGALTLVYAGSLYYNRDLGPIIEAMQLYGRGRETADRRDVHLRIAGPMHPYHAAQLHRQIEASQLRPEQVEHLGLLSRESARDLLRRADIGLVLAQNQAVQVPAKLYECVGMGLPTLVLTEAGSPSASEAERIGADWREPEDIRGICEVMADAAHSRSRPSPVNRDAIDYARIADRVARSLSRKR